MSHLLPIDAGPATVLLVSLFRLNGAMLAAGDRLVDDLGLTSARWQVLGVIANGPMPLPIASIARNMGLTRQGVRQTVGDLVDRGIVRLEPNPHHRRASLVVLTADGERVHRAAKRRWDTWVAELMAGIPDDDVRAGADLLETILDRVGCDETPGKEV